MVCNSKDKFESILDEKELKYEKSCGAVVHRNINGYTEFLLIKSKDNNYWGFPKGHMEGNENEIDTALREVYEETGLNIQIDDGFRVETEYFISREILKKVVYFVGMSNEGAVKIQLEEVGDYKWTNYSDAMNLLNHESSKEILESVQTYLKTSV